MNIALRSSKTVRREVRPGCPLHCFTGSQSFSTISIYRFSAAVQPAGD